MLTFSRYLIGLITLLIIASISCDDILIGLAEEGEPVQLRIELVGSVPEPAGLTNSAETSSVFVKEVSFHLGEISLGNSAEKMYSFVFNDSITVLTPGSANHYVAEKIIPKGVYHDLHFVASDTSEKAQPSIRIRGIFNGEIFSFSLNQPLSIELELKPPLNIKANRDSLTVVRLSIDSSGWFAGSSNQDVLDPNDEENKEEIRTNIINSIYLDRNKKNNGNNGKGGCEGKGNKNCEDNDKTLRVDDSETVEASGVIEFPLELSSASSDTVFVSYETKDNSAKAGEDYMANKGVLEIIPGETEAVIRIDIVDDAGQEPDEKFTLLLSDAIGAEIDNQGKQARGTIIDDDEKHQELPEVYILDSTGNEEDKVIIFTVYLTSEYQETVTVNYETSGNSAKPGDDYQESEGVIAFEPGQIESTVDIELINDEISENEEHFTVRLSGSENADLDNQHKQANGFITDDDLDDETQFPTIKVNDAEAFEASEVIEFLVELSSASEETVSVDFETKDNSAKAGKDYKALTGTLEIVPGETQAVITVELLVDEQPEKDEKFTLILSNAEGAQIDNKGKQAKGTIKDG